MAKEMFPVEEENEEQTEEEKIKPISERATEAEKLKQVGEQIKDKFGMDEFQVEVNKIEKEQK